MTETDLARLLGTKVFGTAISKSSRLARLGYTIKHGRLDLDQIREQLSNAVPVIVRPWTGFLDYWDVGTSHVAVVVGLDETYIYLNDPSFSDHPQRVLHDGFLAAWAEFDETAVVILPAAAR